MYQVVTSTKKLLKLKKRIRAASGGTGASKTISILMILIQYAQTNDNKLISIVSESVPHLRRGAMRDFLNIMKVHNYYDDTAWNRSEFIYTFENGSQIEFFAADQADKLRGGRRDVLFINEANNIKFNAFNELEIRTREIIWLDWNPVMTFWFYEELQGTRDDIDFVTLTFKDNETLEDAIVKSIESRRLSNPNWYNVYALGQLGTLEGVIYTNWETIDRIPEDAELIRKGLDFGYSNDPSVLVDIYRWNNGFILDEQVYASKLKNREIAEYIKSGQPALVIADSAEPKSIDEIAEHGVDIIGSVKGQGSVLQRIQLLQDQKLYITSDSVNVIKDFRHQQWKRDKSGKSLNVPEHEFSHSPDAVGYAMVDILGNSLSIDDIFLG